MTNQIEYKVEWWLFIILLVLITQQNTSVAFLVLPGFNLFLSTTKYVVKLWSFTEFNKAGTSGSGSRTLPSYQNLVIGV